MNKGFLSSAFQFLATGSQDYFHLWPFSELLVFVALSCSIMTPSIFLCPVESNRLRVGESILSKQDKQAGKQMAKKPQNPKLIHSL